MPTQRFLGNSFRRLLSLGPADSWEVLCTASPLVSRAVACPHISVAALFLSDMSTKPWFLAVGESLALECCTLTSKTRKSSPSEVPSPVATIHDYHSFPQFSHSNSSNLWSTSEILKAGLGNPFLCTVLCRRASMYPATTLHGELLRTGTVSGLRFISQKCIGH